MNRIGLVGKLRPGGGFWPPASRPRTLVILRLIDTRTSPSRSPEPPVPSTPDLPPIDADLRRRLTDDILKRGVLVPILQAEDGEVLDGRLRLEIAQEYKLFCPRIIVGKLSPAERADLRLCREPLPPAPEPGPGPGPGRVGPAAGARGIRPPLAEQCGVDHKTVGGGVRRRHGSNLENSPADSRATSDGSSTPRPASPS